jgi:hypothetical protein
MPINNWVRVLDQDQIRATLDSHDRLRGLWFAEQQWPYCGGVFPVSQVVRRIQDDSGKMRPVSRTVLLDQTRCGGITGDTGCGRDCPMMFRDEWLERVEPPASTNTADPETLTVAVRNESEIKASLDSFGRREGLLFMPEMYRYIGRTVRVHRQIETVYELGSSLPTALPVFLLDGLFCSGDIVGDDGPCHRGCRLLWHRDWLSFS